MSHVVARKLVMEMQKTVIFKAGKIETEGTPLLDNHQPCVVWLASDSDFANDILNDLVVYFEYQVMTSGDESLPE